MIGSSLNSMYDFSRMRYSNIVGSFSLSFLLLNYLCIDEVSSFSHMSRHVSSFTRFQRNLKGPILYTKANNDDGGDESLFQEIFDRESSCQSTGDSNTSSKNDFHDLSSIISHVIDQESTTDDKFPTRTSTPSTLPTTNLKPSPNLKPDEIVEYIMAIFVAIGDDDDALDDALEDAFQFTSVQEVYPQVPKPTIRKSWKWGQPTDNIHDETKKGSSVTTSPVIIVENTDNKNAILHSYNNVVQQQQEELHEGLNEPDFGRELTKEYSSLIGCDSYRFVSTPVYDTNDSSNLCHIDVVVEKVEGTKSKTKFYDKGVSTISIVRSFRFYLECSTSAAYCQDMWMIYKVERIGFSFHNQHQNKKSPSSPRNDSNLL